MIIESVDIGGHRFSENILLVWFKTSYSGEKVGFQDCDGQRKECEDREVVQMVDLVQTHF